MPRKRRARSFLFEPAAFLGDPAVRRMSATARGAYITLLCEAWESQHPGHIEADNEELLARLAACTPQEWGKVRDEVAAAFDTKRRPGFWVQRRLARTYSMQSRHFSRARQKAISMAQARWKTVAPQADTCMQHDAPMLVLGSNGSNGSNGSKTLASKGALAPVSKSLDSATSNDENRSPTLSRRVKNPDTERQALELDTFLNSHQVHPENRKILVAHYRANADTIRTPKAYYRPGTPAFEQLLRDLCAKHERNHGGPSNGP